MRLQNKNNKQIATFIFGCKFNKKKKYKNRKPEIQQILDIIPHANNVCY